MSSPLELENLLHLPTLVPATELLNQQTFQTPPHAWRKDNLFTQVLRKELPTWKEAVEWIDALDRHGFTQACPEHAAMALSMIMETGYSPHPARRLAQALAPYVHKLPLDLHYYLAVKSVGFSAEIARLLAASGLDFNAHTGMDPWTPLFELCSGSKPNEKAIALLLELGANPNGIAPRTPLVHALPALGNLLLDAGADPNACDEAGTTYLMWLCSKKDLAPDEDIVSLVKKLVERGVDIHARDQWGRCAQDYAREPKGNQVAWSVVQAYQMEQDTPLAPGTRTRRI